MTEWFRRLADVPGVGYEGDPWVSPAALKERASSPRVFAYDTAEGRRETLMWTTADGTTSASPASRHAALPGAARNESTDRILRRLGEALELPGEAKDYHFAIQGCIDALWGRRRGEPGVLPELERLCWLDIRLVEARPGAITFERDRRLSFARVLAFGCLVRLFDQEGFLREALDVAERAERFNQGTAATVLRERLALAGEDRP